MKNSDLLKKLYELSRFNIRNEEVRKYIENWIYQTELDIAAESVETIGYGAPLKTFTKWLKANRKRLPCLQKVVSLGKNKNIFGCDYFAVCAPTPLGLPQTAHEDSIAKASSLLRCLDMAQLDCTEKLYTPTRAELDAIIKTHKARKDKKKGERALYRFSVKADFDIYVDAEYLMDMLSIFQGNACYYDPSKKNKYGFSSLSNIYFQYKNFRGMLCPVKVKFDD